MTDLLREAIKCIISESYDDLVDVIVRARVHIAKESDPTLIDVITDVRGIQNVVTVKQLGELGKLDVSSKQFVAMKIKFNNAGKPDIHELLHAIKAINGVDLVTIISFAGQQVPSKEFTA